MRPSTLPTPSTRPGGGQRWPSPCRTVQADADDRQSPVSAPDAKLSTLANWAGQIDACRFRMQVGDLVALRSEVWIRIPIASPKSEHIIRNPEPRLGSLVGQPSTARQTGPHVHPAPAFTPRETQLARPAQAGTWVARSELAWKNAPLFCPLTRAALSTCGPAGPSSARVLTVTAAARATGQASHAKRRVGADLLRGWCVLGEVGAPSSRRVRREC